MSRHFLDAGRLAALFRGLPVALPAKSSIEIQLAAAITPAELLALAAGRGGSDAAGTDLQFDRVQFSARHGNGPVHQVEGVVARCDCGSKFWRVFQIDGTTHFHWECANCRVSFCPGGACE